MYSLNQTRFSVSVDLYLYNWRSDSGEFMVGGYTYDWAGHSNGYYAQGVAVAVPNKLSPMIIEETPMSLL